MPPRSEPNLTPQQRKIDYFIRQTAAALQAAGVTSANAAQLNAATTFSTNFVRVDNQARIEVYIIVAAADATSSTLATIETQGNAEIEDRGVALNTFEGFATIPAWVPYTKLEALAALPIVRSIQPPGYATLSSIDSQGDTLLHADQVRSQFGAQGLGIPVGVISDGFNGLPDTGNLPPTVQTFGTCTPKPPITCAEGTAMAEIVHALAPEASLAIGAGAHYQDMIQRVQNLTAWGAKVIVDDLSFMSEPYFQDGPIAQSYEAAAKQGIMMVSAAGNLAQVHYQHLFVDNGSGYNLFGPNDILLNFQIAPGALATINMQWSNPFAAAVDNYQFDILDSSGTHVLAQSNQSGQSPYVYASIPCAVDASQACSRNIRIQKVKGIAQTLELFLIDSCGGGCITLTQSYGSAADSIFGHAAALGVSSVAAVSANTTGNPPVNCVLDPGLDIIEPYSSQGPSTILFPSPQERSTPSITAVDCVSVSGAGGFSTTFSGTSAAAPQVVALRHYCSVFGN
jgi:hypothetical protein